MGSRRCTIPTAIQQILAWDHIVTVADAQAHGVSRARLSRLARTGVLRRLAPGVYVQASTYSETAPWPAFALRTRALVAACGPAAYAAGWSAVAVQGLPVLGPPPARPLIVIPDDAGVSYDSPYGRIRAVALPAQHRDLVSGCRVTSAARTVVDVARTAGREDALVVADAALRTLTTTDRLVHALQHATHWPGVRAATWVVEHADGYAESPLETLGRLTFIENGLPVPISNPWVTAGRRQYRPDHLIPVRWLAFEGDGAFKYDGRLDAGRVIKKQYEREWLLREIGLQVVRYEWELARFNRPRLAARFRAAIASTTVQDRPCRWSRT
ncbi:hypothetical protein EF847_12690 [Actinobacteria bacterium YIM 96077]|uniref:AbiEi antitoxin N-terminal domain-containing protein n=1 Tax=Phytoactinopolyspora halophila TaxID=1981511 RepID=A0A329QZP0_9ACTN|nr:type IV toxin-antitoxin system AbiEi family antitoxin domain-containing protein [Phytoactinopolyspora halophila]AYY13419.1 hypothetical protein EF847_12690 [Actinobacteria bacterium YIM 96077]RAW17346.1 hypothetical protein DPM12_04745 [Phytoactinopolyspora halophila]